MIAAARVTLKQHRFEVGMAALAALVLGMAALFVEYELKAVDVPRGCFDARLATGPSGAGDCAGPIQAWGSILADQGVRIIAAMAYVPFAVGLLGGVPIVGRELESRTAQTAWSLNGSRLRWLIRQIAPVLMFLGLAVTFAALASGAVEADRVVWGQSPFLDIGLHGPPVVARAFGAFGLGLLLGALLGRTLPAFVFGAILLLTLVYQVGVARNAWLNMQHPVVIEDASTAVQTGWAWLTPQGTQVTDLQARAQVPAGMSHPETWLADHGYRLVALGVTEEVAMGWALYDALGFSLVGSASLGATIVVVNRRRPT